MLLSQGWFSLSISIMNQPTLDCISQLITVEPKKSFHRNQITVQQNYKKIKKNRIPRNKLWKSGILRSQKSIRKSVCRLSQVLNDFKNQPTVNQNIVSSFMNRASQREEVRPRDLTVHNRIASNRLSMENALRSQPEVTLSKGQLQKRAPITA